MSELRPFLDDVTSIAIDKLTIENGTDRIALYGSLDLTRDKQGLAHAKALKAVLDQAIAMLNNQVDLLDNLPPSRKPKAVKNPFE